MTQEKIRVLIVDDNQDYTEILQDYFSLCDDIEVIGIAHDGIQAIAQMKELHPDVVLLDMIMPHMDGLSVMEQLQTELIKPMPKIIVLSAISQDQYSTQAMALKASYYLVKPVSLDVLYQRICKAFSQKNDKKSTPTLSVEQVVSSQLVELGIYPHTLGYQYLTSAVLMVLQDERDSFSITKLIYPTVAQRFNTSVSCVDKAMRGAVSSAYQAKNLKLQKALENYNYANERPSNSIFLHLLIDIIKNGGLI